MIISINSIKYNESTVDGPGIRTVLFMQGCNLHCKGCHNKSTWDIEKGEKIEVKKLVEELQSKMLNNKITISGGEPLFQKQALIELINELHKNGFDIALYTGHVKEDVPNEIIHKIRYLKTGPFVESLKTSTKPFVGSTNQQFEEIQ